MAKIEAFTLRRDGLTEDAREQLKQIEQLSDQLIMTIDSRPGMPGNDGAILMIKTAISFVKQNYSLNFGEGK